MNTVVAHPTTSSAWLGVFWGGLICGILDLSSAIIGYGFRGVPPNPHPAIGCSGRARTRLFQWRRSQCGARPIFSFPDRIHGGGRLLLRQSQDHFSHGSPGDLWIAVRRAGLLIHALRRDPALGIASRPRHFFVRISARRPLRASIPGRPADCTRSKPFRQEATVKHC